MIRWLATAIALVIVAGLAIDRLDDALMARAVEQEEQTARNDAAILAAGLRSELDKFSLLPLALAQDPQVRSVLAGSKGDIPSLNRRLEELADQSSAAAIYVIDTDGLALSASNWNRPATFVGTGYSFRNYFAQAMRDGTATEFALGTISRKPGLYISSRVRLADDTIGVVTVKVVFEKLEESWRRATQGVYVTNAEGVVLITSEDAFRFHLTGDAPRSPRDRKRDLQQFGLEKLEPLAIARNSDGEDVVTTPLVDASHEVLPHGWTLHLLVDPGPRVAAAQATGRLALVSGLVVLVALLIMAWFVRRRREAREEAIVAERTRTLRDQLSQANRLATLGQISAGVNHEIGQPVAALRVYAENGEKLLSAGKAQDASSNFRRIVDLADRIGRITGELRQFSRRQPGEKRVTSLGEIIDGSLLLLHDRAASMQMEITLPPAETREVPVLAEHVRLEQVLVNLLQNAMDASPAGSVVNLEIRMSPDTVQLSVVDHGTGIPAERADQLFQPFATDKPDGLGLGLVIAREIMRDLGGELIHEPGRDGTCFTMIIPRAL